MAMVLKLFIFVCVSRWNCVIVRVCVKFDLFVAFHCRAGVYEVQHVSGGAGNVAVFTGKSAISMDPATHDSNGVFALKPKIQLLQCEYQVSAPSPTVMEEGSGIIKN